MHKRNVFFVLVMAAVILAAAQAHGYTGN